MKIVGGSLRLSGSFYVMIVHVTIKIFKNLKQIITMHVQLLSQVAAAA